MQIFQYLKITNYTMVLKIGIQVMTLAVTHMSLVLKAVP